MLKQNKKHFLFQLFYLTINEQQPYLDLNSLQM